MKKVIIRQIEQRKPNTFARVTVQFHEGQSVDGQGFTKLKPGDKWVPKRGVEIAILKAEMDALHQRLVQLTGVRNIKF